MTDGLRQRLVGAVVLCAVVLILWPLVMTPGRDDSYVIESAIPPKPVLAPVDIARPVIEAPVRQVEQPVIVPAPELRKPEPAPAPAPARSVAKPVSQSGPALDSDGLPVSWIVQVGSFGNPENAARLKKTLQEGGFKAHTARQSRSGRTLTRVYVGPYVDKAVAERDRSKIATKTDLAPKVLRFKS